MSDFDRFIEGPITKGDVAEVVRLWKVEYASARYKGFTALHYACVCERGDMEGVVRVLVDHGCDIEAEIDAAAAAADDDRMRFMGRLRPLHFCALMGNRVAMRVLLEAGCCLTALTPGGLTALHYACSCERGDMEGVVRVLVEAGCDIEAEFNVAAANDARIRFRGRLRPLHFCALMGNRVAIRVLLEAGCCLTALTPDGLTALHYACVCERGDREGVVRVLLEAGCDIEAEAEVRVSAGVRLSDLGGWRPLHVCAIKDSQDAMRVLLEAGCCLTALTRGGETPLEIAERENHQECASMLRAAVQTRGHLGAPTVSKDEGQRGASGGSVLNTETKKPIKRVVGDSVSDNLELLKNNSLSKIMDTGTWMTLLEKLLSGKDQKVLDEIKVKQVDEQEMKEWKSLKILRVSPRSYQSIHECLMYRCMHQNYDRGVYSLCTADIVNRASLFMGPTALETAVDSGAVVWVHEILKKLVKIDESWSRAEDIAVKKNLLDIRDMLTKRRDYLTRKNMKGLSRLHIAVIENDPDMVEYLIKNGLVTGDESHKNLGTALSLAYNVDHIDCVQSLQASKVNVNTVDRFMQTPLQVAIANKTEDLCEYLVNNTSSMENTDIFRMTALARSVLNDCRDICERLVRKGAVCDKYVDIPSQLIDIDPDLRMEPSNIPQMPITSQETIYSLCLKSNRTIYSGLLESIDRHTINRPDGNNNSLLHLAAVYLMPDLCSQLISKSADVNSKNDSECTPLLELLKRNCERNIKEVETRVIKTVNVLIDGGASLDVEDADGCSVLEKATSYNNEKLLLALIHKHEHIDRIKKPLWLAWLNKRFFSVVKEVIPLINKASLNEWITRDLIKERLADENTSLAKVMYGHGSYDVKIDIVEAMLYRAAIIGDKDLFKRIIKDDISLNSSLDGGESLLNSLIRKRKIEFIQLVIRSRNGPWFIEKKSTENKLPLHVCIENDYWEVMDQLIVETSSVNEQDNNGNTALSLLLTKISVTDDEITIGRLMTSVKLLIGKSADIYLVNRINRTVITYCTKSDLKLEIESFFRRLPPRQEPVVSPQVAQHLDVVAANICTICEDEPKNCALNCGHVMCMTCAEKTIDCYICRRRITYRTKLFI